MEAAYDWKRAATQKELRVIARISGFYMFWRNAYNQLGTSWLEALTMPTEQYLKRALTGRTKIARTRQQGLMAMALPEWYFWQDGDEIVDDAEQLRLFQERCAPWWRGARPYLPGGEMSDYETSTRKERYGTHDSRASLILPMLTSLDTLTFPAMGVEAVTTAVLGDVELDAGALGENLVEDLVVDKLAPVFSEFVEIFLDWVYDRSKAQRRDSVYVRDNEIELLKLVGLGGEQALDVVAIPDEHGRRYMDGRLYEGMLAVLRQVPIIGTEIPRASKELLVPWKTLEGGKRYGVMAQNVLGITRKPVDPVRSADISASQADAYLKKELKSAEKRGGASYGRSKGTPDEE